MYGKVRERTFKRRFPRFQSRSVERDSNTIMSNRNYGFAQAMNDVNNNANEVSSKSNTLSRADSHHYAVSQPIQQKYGELKGINASKESFLELYEDVHNNSKTCQNAPTPPLRRPFASSPYVEKNKQLREAFFALNTATGNET